MFTAYGFEDAGGAGLLLFLPPKRAERLESSSPSSFFLPIPSFFILKEDCLLRKENLKSEGRLGQIIYGMGNGVAVGLIHRGCFSGACTLKLVPELP